eukprot:ANDGO_05029.mRNA.1 hypothetical protein
MNPLDLAARIAARRQNLQLSQSQTVAPKHDNVHSKDQYMSHIGSSLFQTQKLRINRTVHDKNVAAGQESAQKFASNRKPREQNPWSLRQLPSDVLLRILSFLRLYPDLVVVISSWKRFQQILIHAPSCWKPGFYLPRTVSAKHGVPICRSMQDRVWTFDCMLFQGCMVSPQVFFGTYESRFPICPHVATIRILRCFNLGGLDTNRWNGRWLLPRWKLDPSDTAAETLSIHTPSLLDGYLRRLQAESSVVGFGEEPPTDHLANAQVNGIGGSLPRDVPGPLQSSRLDSRIIDVPIAAWMVKHCPNLQRVQLIQCSDEVLDALSTAIQAACHLIACEDSLPSRSADDLTRHRNSRVEISGQLLPFCMDSSDRQKTATNSRQISVERIGTMTVDPRSHLSMFSFFQGEEARPFT